MTVYTLYFHTGKLLKMYSIRSHSAALKELSTHDAKTYKPKKNWMGN